ncbi:MAG: HlyD family secretion protein [Enterobacteriaceae bacterium]
MLSKKKKTGILGLILLIVLAAILWMWGGKRGMVSTDNAYIQGESTQVSAEVSGRVTKVLIEDNQRVKAGQLLAELDNRDYRAKVKQAEANRNAAQAAIANNRAKVELQKAKVQEAQANVTKTKADSELQQREQSRYAKLIQSGAVSQSQHDLQASKAKGG